MRSTKYGEKTDGKERKRTHFLFFFFSKRIKKEKHFFPLSPARAKLLSLSPTPSHIETTKRSILSKKKDTPKAKSESKKRKNFSLSLSLSLSLSSL